MAETNCNPPLPRGRRQWSYQATILRLIPDVVRGEFANIGVLLAGGGNGRAEHFFLYRSLTDLSRALAFFPQMRDEKRSLEQLIRFEEGLEHLRALLDPPRSILSVAAEILPFDDSALQFSQQCPPIFGICEPGKQHLEASLDEMFERYCLEPKPKDRR